MEQQGEGNEVVVGEGVVLTGRIRGNNNQVVLAGSRHPSTIHLEISGSGNEIHIGHLFAAKGLRISCGSHVPAHQVRLNIGDNFSIEGAGRFLLYTSGNRLTIGKDCMFSNNITIRCGESPHLIFDSETGEYLDQSTGVNIGDHVWIGENAYITKSAGIAGECIVGACAVVTRKFDAPHSAIAGNPAKVVRENVQWIRNRGLLPIGSKFKNSHDAYHARFR